MKRNLPSPADVADALRSMTPDYDDWLAVRTPLTGKDKPFPLLVGPFVDTASLPLDQFTDLADCYMYSLRHGWASWEQKHGKMATRPTGDQVAVIPPREAIMAILDFRGYSGPVDGFTGDNRAKLPLYWRGRLTLDWTLQIRIVSIYCAAYRHGWLLRSEQQ